MRRIFICIFLILLLSSARAQNNDEVTSSSGDLEYGSSVSISPSLRKMQNATGSDIEYSHFFVESILALQENGSMGIGINFAFIPNRIGGYATGTIYNPLNMLTGGLVARPLAGIINTDWQLYGGLAYAQSLEAARGIVNPVGIEVGTRFGARRDTNGGNFAWWSLSLSRLYVNRRAYYTLGLSINLAALLGVWIVL